MMAADPMARFRVGEDVGVSRWLSVSQDMITGFGMSTLDPDPMHIDPAWAVAHSPFGGTIAFGFQTIALLTHLLHAATERGSERDPATTGYHLNYGFNRVRLISPVRCGSKVRGRFVLTARARDEKGRWVTTLGCTIEVEHEPRPALAAEWLTVWVPPPERVARP